MQSNQATADTQPQKQQSLLLISEEAAAPLDQLGDISSEYRLAVEGATNEFRLMAITAKAVALMRQSLSDNLVNRFKALENSKLGFKTDKPNGGYDLATIRECMIEAVLRGVKIVGNELNIIAGNLYITKEGFEGKTDRDPRFNKVRVLPGIPVWEEKHGRAIVPFTATWEFAGKPMELEGDVSVRLQKGSTDDQILGKATRKIYARMWSVAAGEKLPEGDLEDLRDFSQAKQAQVTDVSTSGRKQHRPTIADGTPAPKQPLESLKDSAPDPAAEPSDERDALIAKIQQVRADCGIIEGSLCGQLKKLNIADISDLEDLTLDQCAAVIANWKEIQRALD